MFQEQEVDGIFCDSEEASLGVLKVLLELPDAGKLIFIGFDYNKVIEQSILEGVMEATIVQNPYQMGYKGVLLACELLQGKGVAAQVFTDLVLVTRENLFSPEVQNVIRQYVPVKQY